MNAIITAGTGYREDERTDFSPFSRKSLQSDKGVFDCFKTS